MKQSFDLPENLPVPSDDGQCAHLTAGMPFPVAILQSLATTSQRPIDIVSQPRTIIYFYPRTGVPDQKLPDGWNEIPGARGCTPESCGFRDHHKQLQLLGANVYGCSTQTTDYQREAVERLHLPFDLLSDCQYDLLKSLRLPYFTLQELDNIPLIKRLTIIIHNDTIEHVFYPIFPPDLHYREVINWLEQNPIK
jgi:peroxiredoxin